MFRKRTEEKETSPDAALEEYLTFTASPTRDRATRKQDFEEISQMPGLVSFGTNGRNILIAETEMVTIIDPKTDIEHMIGSFIIYIIRERTEYTRDGLKYRDRMWTVDFRYENTTQIVDGCMHPHIRVSEYKSIDRPTGYLCIQRGQHGVYQAIREARIPEALQQLVDILYMFHDRPFKLVNFWPVSGAKT